MISLEKVSLAYGGTTVLHNISLHIQRGEMVGLLGANGSGKSTLLLLLSGVLQAQEGRVSINGTPMHSLSPQERARRVALVPQNVHGEGTPHFSAMDIALMGRYPYTSFWSGYSQHDRDCAAEALKSAGAEAFAARSIAELSGGELQRVIIARALAQSSECLLLDEATSGLDIARKIDIFDMLRERHSHGMTIINAIHDLNLAALYCERLIFLQKGRVVLDGATADVFTSENLRAIYGTPIEVFTHPHCNAPQAVLLPKGA